MKLKWLFLFGFFFLPCLHGQEKAPVLVDRWGHENEWNFEAPLHTFEKEKPPVPVPTDYKDRTVKAFVYVFLNTECPLVNRFYAAKLRTLDASYRSKKVQFYGIYSEFNTTRLEMGRHKMVQNFSFPVFLDKEGALAKKFGAERSPEVFVFNPDHELVYSGQIDSGLWEGSKRPKEVSPEENYLVNAIEAVLQNQKPAVTHTKPTGCEIPSSAPEWAPSSEEQAAAVIASRCLRCHYDGGPGGYVFETLRGVQKEADTVARAVKYQRMPPPGADFHGGRAIKEQLELTDEEREILLGWLNAGAKSQSPHRKIAPDFVRPKPGEFKIGNGKPDFIFSLVKPFDIPASGDLDYQFFWVPTEITQDRWIKEVEIIPGDSRVVHHSQVHIKDNSSRGTYLPKLSNGLFDFSTALSGALIMADFYGFSGEGARRVASYLPGNEYNTRVYPEGEGVKIPGGSDLIFEMHYTTFGEATKDQSKVGFVWADKAAKTEIRNDVFFRPRDFLIPPHDPHHLAFDDFSFPNNVVLLDIRPHMHLRGSDFKMVLEKPDGSEELLLTVPVYDFKWQHTYVFKEPVVVPAGSSLKTTIHWDNSRVNPNNPDSNQEVIWGQQSNEEMDNVVITYYINE